MDIVRQLWSLNGDTIADSAHAEDSSNLFKFTVASIPLFLKYYKESSIFFAIIHLSSMVPAKDLVPGSTTDSVWMLLVKQI